MFGMKSRLSYVLGFWPAVIFIAAGIAGLHAHQHDLGLLLISGGIIYSVIWLLKGLFNKSS
jgi:hypothetical protein